MGTTSRQIQNLMIAGDLPAFRQFLASQNDEEAAGNHLSRAYAELKHRNIPLSQEMVHLIEYELVKTSYRRTATACQETAKTSEQSGDRAAHLVQCIDQIVQQHRTGMYTDIDEMCVLRLRQVYAHVFFLKTHLRRLPLLQLQFCIAVFLKLVTGKPVNGFDIYAFTIDKVRLIRYLQLIREELTNPPAVVITFEEYTQFVLHSTSRRTFHRIPKRVRTFIWNDIRNDILSLTAGTDLKGTPFDNLPSTLRTYLKVHYEKTIDWERRRRSKRVFKELSDTYYTMKQHYSILKILSYIDNLLGRSEGGSVPGSPTLPRPMPYPTPTRMCAIKRTLQVIGETIKSTRETPNITVKLNRVLQLITSDVLTERTKDLRQFFSHGYPLSKWELERDAREQPKKLVDVFQKIETNLREARRWFVYTQTQQNLRIYRQYLAHLRGFQSIEVLRDYIAFVGTEFKASLVQSYLPEELTEAKLLIEYLLQDFKDPSSDVADGEEEKEKYSVRDEIQYLLRELELRVVAIRSENNSLGRSVDEFFFLETYIRQSTACLERVRAIAGWILERTELSNRHKLVQKTDLMYARELTMRLRTVEQDEARQYLWGNVWERLARESFIGIDTLLGRTESRGDVALNETVQSLQTLGLPLELEEFVSFANRRLTKSYYGNVFVLDNKYRVLKELVKDRRAQVNPRDALEKLKETRKKDELALQQVFDELLDSMEELLDRSPVASDGKLTSATDQIALEYCLLEVAEILCNIALFRDNMAELGQSVAPVVTGRNLRNYLAHDFLAYDTLTHSTGTVVLNAKYLVEHRFKLYSTAQHKTPLAPGTEGKDTYQAIFAQQTEWTIEQVDFFSLVTNFQTHELSQLFERAELGDAGANRLLMRRSFLERDVISIALDTNPACFVRQLLGYEESSGNFLYLLTQYLKLDHLTDKVKVLIQRPHAFCFRLGVKYGLIDVVRDVYCHCEPNMMLQIIDNDFSSLFTNHSTEFIRELMNLLPPEYFLGAGDHLGNTIVHWATLRGDRDLLRFFLGRYRTLINMKNKFGDVPLLLAVRYHGNAVAALLLDWGAGPSVDEKIVKAIAMRDDRELLARIKAPLEAQQPVDNPLRAAIEGNHLEMFVQLHRASGYSLLHGELLHLAARLNRVEFLRYMLDVADHEPHEIPPIDSVNADYCFTPFMLACATGHFDSAHILLQRGANRLFRNENNYSPWHCAVHSGKRNIVALLAPHEHGLDVNLLTRDKRSALTIAIENGQTTMQIVHLLKAGVTLRADDVLRACMLEKLDILRLFIGRHPEFISARDIFQRTPLIIAVVMRNEAMLRYLIDCGADLDAANVLGMNSLHVAVQNNLTSICKTLLAANINVNAEDNCGRTPLVVALEKEHLGMVDMLLLHGAEVESVYQFRYRLHRGATLLHKYTIENRPWMVEYLVNNLRFPTDILDDDGKTASMYKM